MKNNAMTLQERMTSYEYPSTMRRAFKGQPLVLRLNGRHFRLLTKDLEYPYDERLSRLMLDTTKAMVEFFHAKVGYTQSDEMTLVWNIACDDSASFPFEGRLQKIESLCAAYATAFFNKKLATYIPEKAELLLIFDARAFVPNLMEAYNVVLSRQNYAMKHAARSAMYMMGASLGNEPVVIKQKSSWTNETLAAKMGGIFNDYAPSFKRGTFVRRMKREEHPGERQRQVHVQGTQSFTKQASPWSIEATDIWLSRQVQPLDALFFDSDPLPVADFLQTDDVFQMAAGNVAR